MPGLRRTTTCRGCGKPIAFIKTINGKSIPVDPEPLEFIPEAAYEKYVTEDGEVIRGGQAEDSRQNVRTGYRSHFATCPCAEDFRKKRKAERNR